MSSNRNSGVTAGNVGSSTTTTNTTSNGISRYVPSTYVEKCSVLIFYGRRDPAGSTISTVGFKFHSLLVSHDLGTDIPLTALNPYGFEISLPCMIRNPTQSLNETAIAIASEAGGPSTQLLPYSSIRQTARRAATPFTNDEPIRRRFHGITEPFMFTTKEVTGGGIALTWWYLAYNWTSPLPLQESSYGLHFDTTVEKFGALGGLLRDSTEREVVLRAITVLEGMGMMLDEDEDEVELSVEEVVLDTA